MVARPILFSTPMVQALLDGRKTQTRRVIKGVGGDNCIVIKRPSIRRHGVRTHVLDTPHNGTCLYGKVGDLLWVRETWTTGAHCNAIKPRDIPKTQSIGYITDENEAPWLGKIRPSIFMPRWASRLTLKITNIKVERLQDISEDDALAEGIHMCESGYFWWDCNTQKSCYRSAKAAFQGLWELINGKESWDANPWLWAIEFEVIKKNVDEVLK